MKSDFHPIDLYKASGAERVQPYTEQQQVNQGARRRNQARSLTNRSWETSAAAIQPTQPTFTASSEDFGLAIECPGIVTQATADPMPASPAASGHTGEGPSLEAL